MYLVRNDQRRDVKKIPGKLKGEGQGGEGGDGGGGDGGGGK
jgi:hypothetical protein